MKRLTTLFGNLVLIAATTALPFSSSRAIQSGPGYNEPGTYAANPKTTTTQKDTKGSHTSNPNAITYQSPQFPLTNPTTHGRLDLSKTPTEIRKVWLNIIGKC